MLPLSMAGVGSTTTIESIKGKEDVQRFLASLGFVSGSTVTVISDRGGDLIVNVKDSRIAIDRSMANKIMVE